MRTHDEHGCGFDGSVPWERREPTEGMDACNAFGMLAREERERAARSASSSTSLVATGGRFMAGFREALAPRPMLLKPRTPAPRSPVLVPLSSGMAAARRGFHGAPPVLP